MQMFLKEVAKQILEDNRDNLADQIIVLPNRRSSLFFRHYLSHLVDSPILSPEINTINELFSNIAGMETADSLVLIFKMYESYLEIKGGAETFDEFYFWGEMIVNDFDDIDKYIVDQSLLFTNLKDLRDIDEQFGGLEPEIIEIIRQFWKSFDPGNITSEKEDFLAVWDIMTKLYDTYRRNLQKSGIAYEGMIMRGVIDSLEKISESLFEGSKHYHFIGFNALNKCEKELLNYIKKQNRASFYWDYDTLYTTSDEHEAGLFIRDNISNYGQDLRSLVRFDNLINPDQPHNKWEVYKAPSDVAQAKLIPGLLTGLGEVTSDPNDTAIVLADENMLMPVINSIPAEISEVNITMGYPLFQTPVYSLVHQLLSLQKNSRTSDSGVTSFYYADVIRLLGHQYITYNYGDESDGVVNTIREQNLIRIVAEDLRKTDFFKLLFSRANAQTDLNRYLIDVLQEILIGFNSNKDSGDETGAVAGYQLQQEYLYVILKTLKQLETILLDSKIKPGPDIYSRVVDRMIRKLIVPFSGEPLRGIQVLGILETRCLDFKNVIIISANEGVLPKGSAGSSYIPYNLRMAYGLPTVKHQDSIYAYYFYRLIQRSKRVRFVYNSSASGVRTGEMSRFLLQLKYDSNINTEFIESKFSIVPPPIANESIIRDTTIHSFLEENYLSSERSRILSPSALNTWINCRMRFYYRYVVGLQEYEGVKEEVDSPMFGTILHDAMNNLYRDLTGRDITSDDIDGILKNGELVNRVVVQAFRKNFMRNNTSEISGKNLIITSVIENMIRRILIVDKKYTPFEILNLEERYSREVAVNIAGNKRRVRLGGTIDRVDRINSVVRVLDYKSGKDSLSIDSLESLTQYNVQKRNSAAFQTFVYSYIYGPENNVDKIRPSLYPVRSIYEDSFSDIFIIKKGEFKGDVSDFSSIEEQFVLGLKSVISDILNPEFNFDMTTIKESCRYCPFSDICDRQDVK